MRFYKNINAAISVILAVLLAAWTTSATLLASEPSERPSAAQAQAALDILSIYNIDDVRGNIFLPGEVNEISIEWISSNPTVLSNEGVVNRQLGGDVDLELRALISSDIGDSIRNFNVTVRQAVELEPFEGYAFAYFTGNSISGEKIFFAASQGNNALRWTELNGGQPVLTSQMGTKGLRDPFIIRSHEGDKFFLLATDLSIGSGTSWGNAVRFGSRYLEIWESDDLKTWSAQRHVEVSPATAGNTWAPEAFYDDELGAYVVFWASSLHPESDVNHQSSTYHRMMYSTTRDFVTFTPAEIWQDARMSRIDTTVIKAGSLYHRFTKDEGGSSTGCTDIIQERSPSLRAQLDGWTREVACIGRGAGTSAVEGPTVFKSNPGDANGDKFYLFVDEYGGRGYVPLETADIENPAWRVSRSYSLPSSPRHGTVIPITKSELASLTNAPDAKAKNEKGEILRYDFRNIVNGVIPDVSGNDQNGIVHGGAVVQDNGLVFDGSDDYVELPKDLLASLQDAAIEMEVLLDSAQQTPYFLFGIGNTRDTTGNGYLFATGNRYRAGVATGNWETEQTVSSGNDLPRGTWIHLVYTLSGGQATLYLDGEVVGRENDVTIAPGDIGGGRTAASYLGKSVYTGDKLLRGTVRRFAVFGIGLGEEEVRALYLAGV